MCLAANAHPVTPEQYDAWYDTPRGRWIGEREWEMVRDALSLQPGDSVLDVGCGTGWFTRHAASAAAHVVGIDIDAAALDFARRKSQPRVDYLQADATALPFPDACFDKVMSVAALCFVPDWPRAVAEVVRVSRQRFAIGLLNSTSWLHLRKASRRSADRYAGAHWHTGAELAAAMRKVQVADWAVSYGVFMPCGGVWARTLERGLPVSVPFGSFVLLSGRRPPGRSGQIGVMGLHEADAGRTSRRISDHPHACATPISTMTKTTVTCIVRSVTLRSTRLPR